MAEPSVPKLDPVELRSEGYLSEANRVFFHPLGLALAIISTEDDSWEVAVLDGRDDPEGWNFSDELLPLIAENNAKIQAKQAALRDGRIEALGYWEQPVPGQTEVEVARLRLPVPVQYLLQYSRLLEKIYGDDRLIMRQEGNYLVLFSGSSE